MDAVGAVVKAPVQPVGGGDLHAQRPARTVLAAFVLGAPLAWGMVAGHLEVSSSLAAAVVISLAAFSLWLLSFFLPGLRESLRLVTTACFFVLGAYLLVLVRQHALSPASVIAFLVLLGGAIASVPVAFDRAPLLLSFFVFMDLGAVGVGASVAEPLMPPPTLYAGTAALTVIALLALRLRESTLRQVRSGRQRFDALVQGAPIFVWSMDRAGIFTSLEGKSLADLGLRHGEWVGRTIEEVFRRQERIAGELRRVLGGETITFSVELNDHILEVRATPVRDDTGALEGAIGIAADVTERTRSERRYALAAQASSAGIWEWDVQSETMYYSRRWCEMVGLEVGEQRYDADSWFDRIHPEHVDAVRAAVQAHLAGESEHFRQEYRLRRTDGTWLWLHTRGLAERDDRGEARRIAGSSTDITLRKEAEQRVHEEERRDALTGLGNRTLFIERIARALRRAEKVPGSRCAIILLDLDRFTQVNESFGPQAGDEMLKAVAGRLAAVVRDLGLCVRLGGDEFAVLLEGDVDRLLATRTAGRLHEALAVPLLVAETEVFSTISCGISLGDSSYTLPGELLRDADIALHRAKQAGRARFLVFDATMHTRAVAILKLQNDMRKALERREFRLHYQPIVSTRSQMIAGFEALVRWQHPERGMVPPLDFIGPAEDSGFIIPLGHWVMREACRQLQEWSKVVPGYPVTISVNLSGKQFGERRLIEQIGMVIEETGIDPQKLKFEITESVLMENADQAVEMLKKLKDLGIRLQVDDFGTGYSSLAWLHRLPINALKIDKAFIDDMESDKNKFEMVKAIRMMARNLQLAVVAEGIENVTQLEMLKQLGCDYLQGFYISGPVDAKRAGELLGEGTRY